MNGNAHSQPSSLGDAYDRRVDSQDSTSQVFHTGIKALDKKVHPKRGHFVGILGYAKSGKTRFGRTWNYHSLVMGYNVMHLSYEQTFQEELEAYVVIHSHNAALWEPKYAIPWEGLSNGTLTRAQRDHLHKVLIPDLEDHKSLPGQLLIRQPTGKATWDEAMIQVTLANHVLPLDVLFIDDITALEVPDYDSKASHNANIQRAKTTAMTFDDNRGLLIISPFQTNRDEWTKAGSNGGRYAANSAYMYSQVEKAVNEAYYVYLDDNLDQESCVMLGTCIHRHGKNVAPFRAAVEGGCGTFRDFRSEINEINEQKEPCLAKIKLINQQIDALLKISNRDHDHSKAIVKLLREQKAWKAQS